MNKKIKYPGIRITTNGNQLVASYTEARIVDAGVFYPITPSTEQGENFELSYAKGELNVFGESKIAIEAEGEHAAQGGAIAVSVTGKRTVNFTSGQGIVYGLEQYYHALGKLSTMVIEVAARALTKHALNVHCGHDDIMAALDVGWTMLMGKDAQQTADQALILRKVNELSLNPGMNIQDGFLTSHLERTFLMHESELMREFLGRPDDIIDTPTESQKELFGPTRKRIPATIDLKNPVLIGSVQNQEHFMTGQAARRQHFSEPILNFLEEAYKEFGELTGRYYGLLSEYNTENSDTVFFCLGCAAENIEATVDYIKKSRNENFGVIHLNVIRPFPEAAVIEALRGKKNVIVIERTDEQLSPTNPLARDVYTALQKSQDGMVGSTGKLLPTLTPEETPKIFNGVYGVGSRDFRPEHVIGAYEYVNGKIKRQDGKTAEDGYSLIYLGIDHPYAVVADETPSGLPEGAIAIRFHSIGGWGAITTGKNLSEIFGELGGYIASQNPKVDPLTGLDEEFLHVSANPKYGSEKKGAPTNYFMVAAPERIRVNCDLRHVNVVLCCDPKAFTHSNPLEGFDEGGAFVWESDESAEQVWQRIPSKYRQEIIDKKIKIYTLPGFDIAKSATDRKDLQFRMQGNAFLGAFFKVSTFLEDNKIPSQKFLDVVKAQYVKKFGKFGDAVVNSNMTVMKAGFEQVREVQYGGIADTDSSSMRLPYNAPCNKTTVDNSERAPLFSLDRYNKLFREGDEYYQPSTAYTSTGFIAAGTGQQSSKYVARRETPIFIAENCTQCMACITSCPDTALPNTTQEIYSILQTSVLNYVSDDSAKKVLLRNLVTLETNIRAVMTDEIKNNKNHAKPFPDVFNEEIDKLVSSNEELSKMNGAVTTAVIELKKIISEIPLAYNKTVATFASKERKDPGSGGLFSIFVSDLCKGCGECVEQCGDHDALRMVPDTAENNAHHMVGADFSTLLQDTKQKYLGLYNDENIEESKAAALRNHLMVRSNYDALVSGDGACAGCGEKTVMRAMVTLTEAFMRPVYHRKADRLREKVALLKSNGVALLKQLKDKKPDSYSTLRKAVLHLIMDLGGENDKDTDKIQSQHEDKQEESIVEALMMVLEQDAANHKDIQVRDGGKYHGMSVMAMAANTGCNTVFGSTHPNNPHPYPWMNSLFQDGTTVGWLIAESTIQSHARRSVLPERLVDAVLDVNASYSPKDYWRDSHMTDADFSTQECMELPKVLVVGGDGGMGDIGYQNLSKVVLQNRPNVSIILLDTQVYSNTGGQNSDSSVMTGGFDMNQFGAGSQGKLTEKKGVAESMTGGHGSPFVAQVSMANSANLYKAILDGLTYRGVCMIQSFTSCQPEHGVPDDASTLQAQRVRDSRCMPEFVSNPQLGETVFDSFSIKGNPSAKNDWHKKSFADNKKYNYTIVHWAATEARFRRHIVKAKEDEIKDSPFLDDVILRLSQNDVTNRYFNVEGHRAFIPEFGVYTYIDVKGKPVPFKLSRQAVLFCIERRKSWRMLQSKAGIVNNDYQAHKMLLKLADDGTISHEDFVSTKIRVFYEECQRAVKDDDKFNVDNCLKSSTNK